jgi:hypothetical protein
MITTNGEGEIEEHVLATHLGLSHKELRRLRVEGGWRKVGGNGSQRIFWNALGLAEIEKKIRHCENNPCEALPTPVLSQVSLDQREGHVTAIFDPLLPDSEKKSDSPEPLVTILRANGVVRRVTNLRWAEVTVGGQTSRCRFPTTKGLRPGMVFENVALSPDGDFWVFTGAIRPAAGRVLRSF